MRSAHSGELFLKIRIEAIPITDATSPAVASPMGRPTACTRSAAGMAMRRGTDRDRGGHGIDVALEDVGAHAGHVAHVVTDVVGNGRGVARIVLGNSHLDLADQVGAHIGGLGVDAAAHPREQRDARRTHREAGDDLGEPRERIGDFGCGALRKCHHHHDTEAEEAERCDGKSHHGATIECDLERAAQSVGARGFGGANVGLGGGPHAGEPGECGTEAAEDERHTDRRTDRPCERKRHHDHHGEEHHVLALEEGHRAAFDQARDLLHPRRAGGLLREVHEEREGSGQAGATEPRGDRGELVERHGNVRVKLDVRRGAVISWPRGCGDSWRSRSPR